MAARETGVVRQRLGGDTAAAQRLNGIARTQLGILKELMAFGNLQQLSRTVRLGDGTEIFVQSVFGQDSVRITPPVAAIEAVEGAGDVSVGGAYVYVAGFGYDATKGGYRAYRWKVSVTGGGLLAEDDLGIAVFNGSQSIVMSESGDVIVVNTFDATAGTNRVFRWTPLGATDLMAYSPAAGLGASSDASCVLVSDVDPITAMPGMYRWTSASGFVRLVTLDVATYSIPKVSADGKAAVVIGNDSLAGIDRVYYWTESVGTTALTPSSPISVYPVEAFISNDGTTIVFPAYDGGIAQVRAYRWDSAYGFLDTGINHYAGKAVISDSGAAVAALGHDAALSQDRVYAWSTSVGVLDTGVPNAYLTSPAMNPDGTALTAAGFDAALNQTRTYVWRSTNTLIDLGISSLGYGSKISQDGSVVSATGFDQEFTSKNRAYRWAADSGAINLGSFIADGNSFASALSPDGIVVVGDSISAGGQASCAWTPMERVQLGSSTTPLNGPKQITKVFYD